MVRAITLRSRDPLTHSDLLLNLALVVPSSASGCTCKKPTGLSPASCDSNQLLLLCIIGPGKPLRRVVNYVGM